MIQIDFPLRSLDLMVMFLSLLSRLLLAHVVRDGVPLRPLMVINGVPLRPLMVRNGVPLRPLMVRNGVPLRTLMEFYCSYHRVF